MSIFDNLLATAMMGESGGGGGGSSDFSTATVTLICNASDEVPYVMAIAKDAAPPFVPTPRTSGGGFLYNGDEFVYTAILYKGYCLASFQSENSLSATGDATIHGSTALITGDCTITIS